MFIDILYIPKWQPMTAFELTKKMPIAVNYLL